MSELSVFDLLLFWVFFGCLSALVCSLGQRRYKLSPATPAELLIIIVFGVISWLGLGFYWVGKSVDNGKRGW